MTEANKQDMTLKTIDLDRTIQMHLEEDEKLMKLVIITFSKFWNIVIGLQTYFLIWIVTHALAHDYMTSGMVFWIITCDVVFLLDFIASLVYLKNSKIRRFMPYRARNWKLIVIDIISLIPLSFAYQTYVSNENKESIVWRILLQNRCFRVYRLFILLNMFDLTIRTSLQYIVLLGVRFLASAGLVSHLLTCIWVNIPRDQTCEGSEIFCLVLDESNTLLLLVHHCPGFADMIASPQERLVMIVTIVIGVILVYCDLLPYVLLVFMRISRARGEYFQKYLKLERYLKNISVEQSLNDRIQKYFKHFWQSGTTGVEMEYLIADLPLALKKEIFTDIYWDCFRHSDIFRSVSRSCKRSLSLHMITEYCQEGDIICEKDKEKVKMIYLVQGIMELMAEENEESPIMSFSSGTVLGEMSLFVIVKSQAIVRCRTICEIQTLKLRDVFRVLMDYPRDKNIVFQKLHKRLVIAKITQWRKRQIMIERMIGLDVAGGQMTMEDNEDCVKWIKTQWRAIWETHERHILVVKAIEGGLRIPAWRKHYEIQARLDTVSSYMDLMVLSDVFEEKKDVVCLKTSFPWAIDPKAEFLALWKIVVVMVALFTSTVYPFCTGWLDEFPNIVFTISIPCSLIFEIDLALLLMTAVKTKHGIITKFSSILINCLKNPTFYMDIIAAIPYQLYAAFANQGMGRTNGLCLLPCVLKAHVFFKPRTSMSKSMVSVSLIKNIFIFLLLIFWYAAVFQLISIRCIPYCDFFEWDVSKDMLKDPFIKKYLVSMFVAVSSAVGIPDYAYTKDDLSFLLAKIFSNMLFFFWACFFIGDFYTVYTVKITNKLRFKILFDRVLKYLDRAQISPLLEKRILRIVRFQWVYNKADDLLTKVPIIALAPKSLRREIYADSIYNTLRKCPLFENESSEFIYDVIEKANLIAVPTGTILVNYGLQCYRLHMIHKGYCQINSFLKDDVSGGLGSPVLIRPGDVFPTLASFAATPVPISVLSLTDCEIVVVPLEELLKTMITHDIFRDLVSVLNSNNYMERLSQHMLAMIRVNVQYNAPPDKKAEFEVPFHKFGFLGRVLKCVLFNRDLFFDQNQKQKTFFRIVHMIYIVYLMMNAILWPLCFGLLMFQSHFLFPFLLATKVYSIFYIYIRFHVPYFDKRGLLITHPLYTMYHYLTTAFFFDLMINCPYYSFYKYLVADPYSQDSVAVVMVLILQKLLAIFPLNGFFNDITEDSNYLSFYRPLKFLLILAIVFNAFANFEMFYSVEMVYDGKYTVIGFHPAIKTGVYQCRTVEDNDVVGLYAAITFWMIGHFTRNNITCDSVSLEEHMFALVCSTIGALVCWVFYGWMASHSTITDGVATLYQERMKSFLQFMVSSKTDDKIVENSIGYFEHQWSRSRGQNLKEICENLPNHLHEELAYPLYRQTLSKLGLFSNVDEGFYRVVSTQLELVHFNRGSMIFFRGQVQSDIFFIHSGKCFVFDWFESLDVGSMIGDLNRTGIVENKVYALTHVELLRISSDSFYRIINNFYDVEQVYLRKAASAENYIKSSYVPQSNQLRPVDSRDVLNAFNLQSKDLGFEDQSYFEDPENITTQTRLVEKQSSRHKRFTFTIYPGTMPMLLYKVSLLTVAFLTMILLPNLLFFGSLTYSAFIIVFTLDVLWALLLVVTFRVGVEDKVKGDIITDFRYIAKTFVRKWDGFFMHLIACVPFDIIPILVVEDLSLVDPVLVTWLRSLRFIRGYYLFKYLHVEVNKLKVNSAIRYMSVILYFTLYVHFLVFFYLLIVTEEEIVFAMNPFEFGGEQVKAIILVYEYVLNLVTSTDMSVISHKTKKEMFYFDLVTMLSIYIKGLIIKNILSVKYVYSLARGKYKSQVALLENNLKRHEISPSILKEVLDYKLNLLIATRSESMPTFLLSAPPSLKLAIMVDLYLQRLLTSPVFRDIDMNFLKLLVCRMKRQLYFPGQQILEKGDVDNTMYFIHRGEVYVIDQTEDDAYIEYVVDRMFPGDEFGVIQGLALAKPHKNTFRARTVVELVTLHSSDWSDLRKTHPQIFMKIVETAKKLQFE